jgi:hypothetical protein
MWQPFTADGKPSPDKKIATMVTLDSSFYNCLANERLRDTARRVLIETDPYFRPDERLAVYSMLKKNYTE